MIDRDARDDAIIRDLLERIDGDETVNQRALASELGIALGMTNAYLKRCVKKGWVKVRQVPARRYRYYLTPKGFAEKTRLTAEYFSDSLKFFRRARQSFDRLYGDLEAQGVRRVILCGADELTEIAILCAFNHGIDVVGVVRGDGRVDDVGGMPALDRITPPAADRWIVATTRDAATVFETTTARQAGQTVVYPDLLGSVMRERT
ncbi:MAG: winged helix-turn-helix transcriptional regulator [Vicinamibacterales bacterium]|nr:winged helix-turn-helix transcriptional regulator [Vicinamibacterales bacterium]